MIPPAERDAEGCSCVWDDSAGIAAGLLVVASVALVVVRRSTRPRA